MVHVRIGADVQCSDGLGGRLTQIIAQRGTRRVTHIVVERKGFGTDERLVPVEQVAEGTTERIVLHCSIGGLASMPSLTEIHYEPQGPGAYSFPGGNPYLPSGMSIMAVEEEQLPDNARPVRQGMRVEADDGPVGKVYELLVDTTTKEVTHVVLVDGHLWRKRAITVPLSSAKRVTDDTIFLKLSKKAVGALPSESLAELDRTALEDQLADVTARLARIETDLATVSPDDRARLQADLQRLQRLQQELRTQLGASA